MKLLFRRSRPRYHERAEQQPLHREGAGTTHESECVGSGACIRLQRLEGPLLDLFGSSSSGDARRAYSGSPFVHNVLTTLRPVSLMLPLSGGWGEASSLGAVLQTKKGREVSCVASRPPPSSPHSRARLAAAPLSHSLHSGTSDHPVAGDKPLAVARGAPPRSPASEPFSHLGEAERNAEAIHFAAMFAMCALRARDPPRHTLSPHSRGCDARVRPRRNINNVICRHASKSLARPARRATPERRRAEWSPR
jgi:hypothetical protein